MASNLFSYKTYTVYEALVVFTGIVTKVKIGQHSPGSRFSRAEIDFENMVLRLYVKDLECSTTDEVASVHDLILGIDDE